jgi:DNA-binding winged helix-turn-helix (wHTH) protein
LAREICGTAGPATDAMNSPAPDDASVRFGPFRLHPIQGLSRGAAEIRVTPKALAVLQALVGQAGRVVTKEKLFRTVWPDAVVTDATLSSCILELRKALGDNARQPRYIETLHRRGFRFLAATTLPAPGRHGDGSDHSDDAARAALHLQRAVDDARERATHNDLHDRLRRALQALERQPESSVRDVNEAIVRVELGSALVAVRGVGDPQVDAYYERALDVCRRLGADIALVDVFWGLWVYYFNRGPLSIAEELVGTLTELARASADPALLLQAEHARWPTALLLGRVDDVRTSQQRSLELCSDRNDAPAHTYGCTLYDASFRNHHALVCSGFFAAWADALAGRTAAAERGIQTVVLRARELADPFTLAVALAFAGATYLTLRNSQAGRVYAAEAAALARDHGFHLVFAWASIYEGRAIADDGRASAGLVLMREGLAAARMIGSPLFQAFQLALLAETQCREGLYAESALSLQEAEGITRRTGERLSVAEVHRVKGELRLAMASDAASRTRVEMDLRTAIAVAQEQGAYLLALRAAVTLGGLLTDTGRVDEARALLRAALSRVSGDSSDIAEAKAGIARIRTIEGRISTES